MTKALTIACFLLFLAGVGMVLAQMWGHVWDADTFIKILITDGCVFVIVFVLAFLIRESHASKKIGNDEL